MCVSGVILLLTASVNSTTLHPSPRMRDKRGVPFPSTHRQLESTSSPESLPPHSPFPLQTTPIPEDLHQQGISFPIPSTPRMDGFFSVHSTSWILLWGVWRWLESESSICHLKWLSFHRSRLYSRFCHTSLLQRMNRIILTNPSIESPIQLNNPLHPHSTSSQESFHLVGSLSWIVEGGTQW